MQPGGAACPISRSDIDWMRSFCSRRAENSSTPLIAVSSAAAEPVSFAYFGPRGIDLQPGTGKLVDRQAQLLGILPHVGNDPLQMSAYSISCACGETILS